MWRQGEVVVLPFYLCSLLLSGKWEEESSPPCKVIIGLQGFK